MNSAVSQLSKLLLRLMRYPFEEGWEETKKERGRDEERRETNGIGGLEKIERKEK